MNENDLKNLNFLLSLKVDHFQKNLMVIEEKMVPFMVMFYVEKSWKKDSELFEVQIWALSLNGFENS
jgi:hypothetical protein